MTAFLLVTDLDNTLVGDTDALLELNRRLTEHREAFGTKLVYSTGRSLASYRLLCDEQMLLTPDALVTGVGTAIYYGAAGEPDPVWAGQLMRGWDRDRVVAAAAHFADLVPQPEVEQGRFKVSYYLWETVAADVLPTLERTMASEGLHVKIIYSGGKDLDILPQAADKGLAMRFLREQWQFPVERTVACGDSGNDIALFSAGQERGIIVGNARPELLEWYQTNPATHRYHATGHCAQGIIEGLHYFNFFDCPQAV